MIDLISDFTNSNEQLIQLVITILVIVFVISLLRSVFRLLMPVMVIGLIMVVFLGFTPSDVINKGKQLVTEGKNLVLENILPFLNPNNGEHLDGENNGELEITPEQDPYQDGEGSRKSDQKDTEIFGEQEDEDLVNKL